VEVLIFDGNGINKCADAKTEFARNIRKSASKEQQNSTMNESNS
jgi:hypothetical protein